MAIQITCPACGTKSYAPDGSEGRRAKCCKCDAFIKIPNDAMETIQFDQRKECDHILLIEKLARSSGIDNDRGRIGRFSIVRQLGEGALGVVYLGYDPKLKRQVAIKVPKFANGHNEAKKRFLREGIAAARINHANVCQIYDVGEYKFNPYITMCYIEGVSLKDYLAKNHRLDLIEAADIVKGICNGLTAVHSCNLLHRDIKPGNVMLDQHKKPIILDFGLSRTIENEADQEQLTGFGQIVGTPSYMAPEQIDPSCGLIGTHTDMYSLGVLFYQLLTGRLPFLGSNWPELSDNILHSSPVLPSTLAPELDPTVDRLILRMMAKAPESRYHSLNDCIKQIDTCIRLYNNGKKSSTHTATIKLIKLAAINKLQFLRLKSTRGPFSITAIAVSVAIISLMFIIYIDRKNIGNPRSPSPSSEPSKSNLDLLESHILFRKSPFEGYFNYRGIDTTKTRSEDISIPFADDDPDTKAVLESLSTKANFPFDTETPLEEFIQYVRTITSNDRTSPNGIAVYFDTTNVPEDLTLASGVKFDIQHVPVGFAMHAVLNQLGLTYIIRHGHLFVIKN